MENELKKAAEGVSFEMWQAYCNKKIECEKLQEKIDEQATLIADLEIKSAHMADLVGIANKALRRIAKLEAQVKELQREKKGMCLLPAKELGELDYWLSRCEDKGHLENCPDLIEPYNALYAAIAAHNIK